MLMFLGGHTHSECTQRLSTLHYVFLTNHTCVGCEMLYGDVSSNTGPLKLDLFTDQGQNTCSVAEKCSFFIGFDKAL